MRSPEHLRGVTVPAAPAPDPFLRPQTSTRNKVGRLCWGLVYVLLFRPSPRPLHAWRAFLLRCFGARIGAHCHVYPGARVWAPWNLEMDDFASLADESVVYNAGKLFMGSHAVVSQQAYICTASHDFDDPAFPMVTSPIRLGRYSWICARACVLPGVTVGEGAVLGLAAVAAKDLEPWQVYAGNPATRVRQRRRPATG
jgi:putative colanic acid biosynthesis acetyltransferase WcaF